MEDGRGDILLRIELHPQIPQCRIRLYLTSIGKIQHHVLFGETILFPFSAASAIKPNLLRRNKIVETGFGLDKQIWTVVSSPQCL